MHRLRLVWNLVWPVAAVAVLICMSTATHAQEEIIPCEDAKIVARVGTEVILASDVITQFVRDTLGKLDEPIPQAQREQLIKSRLRYYIELKLLLLDAKREIPEEALPKVQESIAKFFDEKEVPAMMEAVKAKSRQELDEKLHYLGTSLQRQKLVFIDRMLAIQWMNQKTEKADPVTHDKMLAYYQEHLADYEHPARARWEELAVHIAPNVNRQEAYARIVRMGNMVQDGVSFSEVAQKDSDGLTAAKGGVRDWTTQGSLVAKNIDRAIFDLPVGALSPILESKRGFHIVRVIERRDAYRTPFLDAQSDIRKTLENQQFSQERKEYLAKLEDSAKIWTMFDKPNQKTLQANRQATPRYPQTQQR